MIFSTFFQPSDFAKIGVSPRREHKIRGFQASKIDEKSARNNNKKLMQEKSRKNWILELPAIAFGRFGGLLGVLWMANSTKNRSFGASWAAVGQPLGIWDRFWDIWWVFGVDFKAIWWVFGTIFHVQRY